MRLIPNFFVSILAFFSFLISIEAQSIHIQTTYENNALKSAFITCPGYDGYPAATLEINEYTQMSTQEAKNFYLNIERLKKKYGLRVSSRTNKRSGSKTIERVDGTISGHLDGTGHALCQFIHLLAERENQNIAISPHAYGGVNRGNGGGNKRNQKVVKKDPSKFSIETEVENTKLTKYIIYCPPFNGLKARTFDFNKLKAPLTKEQEAILKEIFKLEGQYQSKYGKRVITGKLPDPNKGVIDYVDTFCQGPMDATAKRICQLYQKLFKIEKAKNKSNVSFEMVKPDHTYKRDPSKLSIRTQMDDEGGMKEWIVSCPSCFGFPAVSVDIRKMPSITEKQSMELNNLINQFENKNGISYSIPNYGRKGGNDFVKETFSQGPMDALAKRICQFIHKLIQEEKDAAVNKNTNRKGRGKADPGPHDDNPKVDPKMGHDDNKGQGDVNVDLPNPMHKGDKYIKVKSFNGQPITGWILVQSTKWSGYNGITELSFTKYVDGSSPTFSDAFRNGNFFPVVVVVEARSSHSSNSPSYNTYELMDVTVVSLTIQENRNHGAGGAPMETIKVSFGGMSVKTAGN